MFAYVKRWLTKPSNNNLKRSNGSLQFRGHIERLEDRTVLSASFGLPITVAVTHDSPEFSGGSLAYEIVSHESSHYQNSASLPSLSSSSSRSEQDQPEQFNSGQNITSTLAAFDAIDSFETTGSSQASSRAASGTAPFFSETGAGFARTPLAGLLTLESTQTLSENELDNSAIDSQEFVPHYPSATYEALSVLDSSESTTFESLDSTLLASADSDDKDSKKLRFRLHDDLAEPLDAVTGEQDAIDAALFELYETPEWRDESPRKTDEGDRASDDAESYRATEIEEDAITVSNVPSMRNNYSEGGMIMLQADGDPNLDAGDLVAILTRGQIELDSQSGTELSVGSYQRFEIGGGTSNLESPKVTAPPMHPATETRSSVRSEQGGGSSQSS